jgi:hypothetical protein
MYLAFRADDEDGVAWPARTAIADAANITERHVKRIINQLEEAGDLCYKPGRGRGNRSMYLLAIGRKEEDLREVMKRRLDLSESEIASWFSGGGDRQEASEEKGTLSSEKGTFSLEKGTLSSKKGDILALFPPSPNDNISNPLPPISGKTGTDREIQRGVAFAPPPVRPGLLCSLNGSLADFDWKPIVTGDGVPSQFADLPPRGQFDHLQAWWNGLSEEFDLPSVRKCTSKRRKGIKQRGGQVWQHRGDIRREIARSRFLQGEASHWRVNFDFFLCRTDGLTKTLEGNYRDTDGGRTNRNGRGGNRCRDPASDFEHNRRLAERAFAD